MLNDRPELENNLNANEPDNWKLPPSINNLAPILMGLAALPKAFEQHPQGAKILIRLLVLTLVCWVLVTYLKYGRG